MGIQDRDYMRRPPDDDDDETESADPDAGAERVNQFLERNSRALRYAGIVIGALIVIAVIVALVSGKKP